MLARTYDEEREDDRADRAYTTSIELLLRQNGWLRELAKAYRWYGKFLRRTGRPEAAMDALEQASDLSLRVKQAAGDGCRSGSLLVEVLEDHAAAVGKPCFV